MQTRDLSNHMDDLYKAIHQDNRQTKNQGKLNEWCQDMHDGTGMCRGGSWIHNARNCDPSLPNETSRAFSINSLGLRLALDK